SHNSCISQFKCHQGNRGSYPYNFPQRCWVRYCSDPCPFPTNQIQYIVVQRLKAFMLPSIAAKCFDETLYENFEVGDSWARIYQGSIQACTCVNGKIDCCPSDPCLLRGTRSIYLFIYFGTGSKSFAFPSSSAPSQSCYLGNATNYLGLAKKTISGDDCLPWTSDLLSYHDDPQTNTVQLGLGSHSYCRSPDEDEQPWCYFIKDGGLSWGYCNVIQLGLHSVDKFVMVKKSCGRRHKKQKFVRPRIVGGSSALPGSHPWLASINVGRNFCAGSLIRSCWLVTSAHCFANSPLTSTIHVVLGQHFFNKTTDVTQEFKIEKYIMHPDYSVFNPTENDIVLIKLKKVNQRCAVRSRFIQPICLPEASMSFPDHYKCYVAGWGYLHQNSSRYSNVVQEALIPIIPDYKCQNADVYGAEISENMFCAGYLDGRSDACQQHFGRISSAIIRLLYGVCMWVRVSQTCGFKFEASVCVAGCSFYILMVVSLGLCLLDLEFV
uniref:HGF activator n=1 Tax=Laticauda laticaudata TaxID=8630 RepID=A0A8C5RKM7_LATLA